MYDLKKTLIRIDKIKRTLEQFSEDNKNLRHKLSTRDEPLVQKVKKLEQQLRSMESLHLGQENVLRSLQDKLDKLANEKKETDNGTTKSPASEAPSSGTLTDPRP